MDHLMGRLTAKVRRDRTALERLMSYWHEYGDHTGGFGQDVEGLVEAFNESPHKTWLSIEENERGGYFLSLHASRYDAADYSSQQDSAEEWTVRMAVDLTTGERWIAEQEIEIRYTWKKAT